MTRRSLQRLALTATIAIVAIAFPALSNIPNAAGADVACKDRYPAPVLTGYGVLSQTACDGSEFHAVSTTCNEILATWNGVSDWVVNGGGGLCGSNGSLLDFGPCAAGTWKYRSLAILDGAYGFIGGRISDEVAIRC